YFLCVLAYVASHADRSPEVEDLVSEIFMRVIEDLDRFEYRGPGSFAAWLFRIAHNAVVDFQRRQRRRGPTLSLAAILGYPSAEPSPDEAVLRAEIGDLLRREIDALTPRRREVVLFKFFGGLRNREIAAVLHLDERSVAAHLSRALDDMAGSLQRDGLP